MTDFDEHKSVTVNSRVTIRGFEPGEEETYEIVDDTQANVQENKLPASSPLAGLLLGAHVGEQVSFHPPGGPVRLTIVDVAPV